MQEGIAETLLDGDEEERVIAFLGPSVSTPGTFDDGALEDVRAYSRPGRLDAALGQDRASYEAGRGRSRLRTLPR